jgi:hypothetical protein
MDTSLTSTHNVKARRNFWLLLLLEGDDEVDGDADDDSTSIPEAIPTPAIEDQREQC